MASKKKGTEKVVDWFLPNKSLIKFQGEEDSIAVAENVMNKSNFDKYPVLKGDTVEVTEKDDEVTFLRKVKGASKKKESTEKKKESNTEIDETITKEVVCVSQYGVKFVGDEKWTNFSDELQKQDVKAMGAVAKNTITVSMSKGKIVDIKEEKKDKKQSKSTTRTPYGSPDDLIAKAKNTASMNAKDVVVALISQNRVETNNEGNIERAISALTKKFYEVTKEL